MCRRATTHEERVSIVERHLAGEPLSTIAADMRLSYYTVREWWQVYRRKGWEGLVPKPQGPPRVGYLGRFSVLVKYVALRLKLEHPGWGVNTLLLEMSRRGSLQHVDLPKRSALAVYLGQFGSRLQRPRRAPTRRPSTPVVSAEEVHQCWQMDIKGDEQVGGSHITVAPLMVCDEASGAPLAGIVHTLRAKGDRTGLTTRRVQQDLRWVFTCWGLPDALRIDRDPLFVGDAKMQWPGTLILWLVGLGITPVINRVYRPTDNAIVERNHWTWELHVLLGQSYADASQVQQATDRSFLDRREFLPSRHRGCHGQPPAKAFPALNTPRRPYSPEMEADLFVLDRVDDYLSQWEFRRTVDSRGKISLANRNHLIGRTYCGQMVKIRFDRSDRRFVCTDATGNGIARIVVPEVSREYILGIEPYNDL
jgi:transposase InsO family protein